MEFRIFVGKTLEPVHASLTLSAYTVHRFRFCDDISKMPKYRLLIDTADKKIPKFKRGSFIKFSTLFFYD